MFKELSAERCRKIGQLCKKVGHRGEKKADQRYVKVIRKAVLRGGQRILERYILKMCYIR